MTEPITILYTDSNDKTRQYYRKLEKGKFRTPLWQFQPSQMANDVAMAACGTLYIDKPELFTRSALKHAVYLITHMAVTARPKIVLAFEQGPNNPHNDTGDFFRKYFPEHPHSTQSKQVGKKREEDQRS